MSVKYVYSISNDFPNGAVEPATLAYEIGESTIIIALDYINTYQDDCDVWFKGTLSGTDVTTLSGVIAAHTGVATVVTPPIAADGRPIVRSDSRPVGYYTYFTMRGDTASGIGDGKAMFFDFLDDTDVVASGVGYHEGYKTKRMELTFIDPVYVKEGTVYFFDAPKKSFLDFRVVCPAGAYYYDAQGNPQLASEDTEIVNYVNSHFFSGSCPMGDELNTEGCSENPIPVGYKLRFDVHVPTTVSGYEDCYGYGEVEMYRPRTVVIA